MLNKSHNSIVTLAIFLALVGVSKPAKAFLLAQADVTPTTFTVPDQLPEAAAVKILASDSTASINQSLKEDFTAKFPQATVNLETRNSEVALKTLSEGKADIVGIGRPLTAAEQQQGFVAVPVSREKIAIVISPDNPYDGNLTISEFAKIFRGEITDWSEIGGNAGSISLVDAPDANDTRQAFPNYSVFQEGEFATGSNAVKLDQDSTDAMISQLGANGIGYAVANDVINRDDVKVVTMHQTQPDDPRYPFSQPFYLVYQGTPSEATKAFLGFATTEAGGEVVANRVGSFSTAAATAIASKLGDKPADAPSGSVDLPETTVDGEGEVVKPETIGKIADGEADPDAVAENEIADGETDPDVVAEDEIADSQTETDTVVGGDTANTDPNSGEVNSELDGSGEVNSELDGSGEVNPELDGSGEVNPELDGSGEPNATIDSESDEITVPGEVEGDGTVATEQEGKWWWWLPLIIGIPVLALVALSGFGRGKKSDREPAISDIPNANFPDNDGGIPLKPNDGGGGDLSAVGTSVAANEGSVAGSSVTTSSSRLSGEAIASGTAMAGGAAAANVVGRKEAIEDEVELSDAETDNPIVEIPSDPVTEFTEQETDLQTSGQPTKIQTDVTEQETKLQTTDQSTTIQTDSAEDLDSTGSEFLDGISARSNTVAGGAAALGGAAAVSSFLNDRENTSEETEENSVFESENPTLLQTGSAWDQTTKLQLEDDEYLDSNGTNESSEVVDNSLLDEEITSELSQDLGTETTVETSNIDSSVDSSIDATLVEDTVVQTKTGLSDELSESVPLEEVLDDATATSDLFTDRDSQDTANISEVDINSSPELSNSDSFANNIIADAETTPDDTNLEGVDLDNSDSSVDLNLDEITFDDVDSPDTNLEGVDLENSDSSVDLNLDEITFDDVDSLDTNLGGVDLDNSDSSVDLNLDEITFDDVDSPDTNLGGVDLENSDSSVDLNLDEITFDDVGSPDTNLGGVDLENSDSSVDLNLDEITFDDVDNSIDSFIDDLDLDGQQKDIDINDLGLEETTDSSAPDSLGINAAEINDISNNKSDDMNDISAWLDSLETPNQNSEDITEWLDRLTTNENSPKFQKQENDISKTEVESSDNLEDISFQFLEDLLERDTQKNQDS